MGRNQRLKLLSNLCVKPANPQRPRYNYDVEPGSVIVRIKLRYDTIDMFVEKYAINVGRTAVFLPTKSTRDVGSEVRFELRIANDKTALVGIGKVLAVRPFDAKRPTSTFGMVVELTRITKESRSIVQRMLDIRKQRGLDDMALPIPVSAEAAQRPVVESTGVQEIPLPLTEPLRDSAPILVVAPRPSMAKIAQAMGSLAATNERFFAPDEDEFLRSTVDMPSALALARKLAVSGPGLDADLVALQQSVSVPLAIDIDEASAQLAQVIGGIAVKHQHRSASWATPPRVAAATPAATIPSTTKRITMAPPMPAVAAPALAPQVTPLVRGKGPTSPPPPARKQPGTLAPDPVAQLANPHDDVLLAAPERLSEQAEIVFDTAFQAPGVAALDDDFAQLPQPATAEEPTQIGQLIPPPRAASALLISDDMDLNFLAEHTDFSAVRPSVPAPADAMAAQPEYSESAEADPVEIDDAAVEIEADAADEWIQGRPTVMGALDAAIIEGAYRDPVVTPLPRAGSEFDFSDIASTLRRRASTAPPLQNRTFAHTLPSSARTNRHITTRNTAQPANRPATTLPVWGDDEAPDFDAPPPATVLAPDISARLSAIAAVDDDSDFSHNGPLTYAERPVLPVFQPAPAPPTSPSLDDALLSMSDEADDDDGFFFEPPEHLPDDFAVDSPSITSAAPIVQSDDDIPIEMDFEVLAEFDDDGT